MDGANVCRQKEVRLQHYPVGHHHRRRPPRARLFRARQAPLSSRNTTTRRGAFWRFVVRPTHDGDRKLARAQESPQRKQKTGPTESNSVCLSSDASRARRRVGVPWGFGRNSGCRASGDHRTPQFVIRVASCFCLPRLSGVRAVLGLKRSAPRCSSPAPASARLHPFEGGPTL